MMWLWLWLSVWVAGAHTFDAGFLGLTETADHTWSMTWSPPEGAAGIGLAQMGPDLPCGLREGLMVCDGELGVVGVDGLDASALQVVLMVQWGDGAQFTQVLTADSPWVQPRRASGFLGSVPIGWEHLWVGWDHLLLVAALGWVARGSRLLWAVGAFTLGHGCTLALVLGGQLSLAAPPVEALIALSVAWLAREAVVRPGEDRSVVGLALGFGLLHGLGFAGALQQLGLPDAGLWRVLVGFHVGLEVGQLAWLAVLALPIWALRQAPDNLQAVPLWGVGSVAMAGFFLRLGALGQ